MAELNEDSDEEGWALLSGLSNANFTDVDFPSPPPSPPTTTYNLPTSTSSSLSSIIYEDALPSLPASAYSSLAFGESLEEPAVRIVQTPDRGEILVATKPIPRNAIIFTERSVTSLPINVLTNSSRTTPLFCFACGSSLALPSRLNKNLPFIDESTWPTIRIILAPCSSSSSFCGTSFCSPSCKKQYFESYFPTITCCQLMSCLELLKPPPPSSPSAESDDEDTIPTIEPLALLSIQVYVRCLCSYRKSLLTNKDDTTIDPFGDFKGVCGESSWFSALPIRESLPTSISSLLMKMTEILSITQSEASLFNQAFLEACFAKSCCNTFEIQSESPFTSYYNALLRKFGRDSVQLREATKVLAEGFGNEGGKLKRTDDALVDSLVTVNSACLFQLVSKINHSCSPNSEVRAKCFKDTTCDVVCVKEIPKGGEVNISYLNLGKSAGLRAQKKHNRITELKKRYLFDCCCSRCESSEASEL